MSTLTAMRERLAANHKALARLEAGVCPDLPDDMDLRKALIRTHSMAIDGCNRVIADILRMNLEPLDPEELA